MSCSEPSSSKTWQFKTVWGRENLKRTNKYIWLKTETRQKNITDKINSKTGRALWLQQKSIKASQTTTIAAAAAAAYKTAVCETSRDTSIYCSSNVCLLMWTLLRRWCWVYFPRKKQSIIKQVKGCKCCLYYSKHECFCFSGEAVSSGYPPLFPLSPFSCCPSPKIFHVSQSVSQWSSGWTPGALSGFKKE